MLLSYSSIFQKSIENEIEKMVINLIIFEFRGILQFCVPWILLCP